MRDGCMKHGMERESPSGEHYQAAIPFEGLAFKMHLRVLPKGKYHSGVPIPLGQGCSRSTESHPP